MAMGHVPLHAYMKHATKTVVATEIDMTIFLIFMQYCLTLLSIEKMELLL